MISSHTSNPQLTWVTQSTCIKIELNETIEGKLHIGNNYPSNLIDLHIEFQSSFKTLREESSKTAIVEAQKKGIKINQVTVSKVLHFLEKKKSFMFWQTIQINMR